MKWFVSSDALTLQFPLPQEREIVIAMLKAIRSEDARSQMELDALIVRLGGEPNKPPDVDYELMQQ